LLLQNLVKCPPRYAKLIVAGREGHEQFLKEVAADFLKSGRTGLEKVPDDLISDDDLSRLSAESMELTSDVYPAKVAFPEKSSSTASIPETTQVAYIQSKPPPPSKASQTTSTTTTASTASSSLHIEEEEEEEVEEEEYGEDSGPSIGPSRRYSLVDQEASEDREPTRRGIKRSLDGESLQLSQSTTLTESRRSPMVHFRRKKGKGDEEMVRDAGIGSVFFQMNMIPRRRINVHHPLLKIAQDTQVSKQ